MQKSANRRDALLTATGAVAFIGAALVAWPFIDQANPDASVIRPLEVDLLSILEGQEKLFSWKHQPLLVRHRSPREIAVANGIQVENLRDSLARNLNLDAGETAIDKNRAVSFDPRYVVIVPLCTREGCFLFSKDNEADFAGRGWQCPCCSSAFDSCGRVFSGIASTNLVIPPYRRISQKLIRFEELPLL